MEITDQDERKAIEEARYKLRELDNSKVFGDPYNKHYISLHENTVRALLQRATRSHD